MHVPVLNEPRSPISSASVISKVKWPALPVDESQFEDAQEEEEEGIIIMGRNNNSGSCDSLDALEQLAHAAALRIIEHNNDKKSNCSSCSCNCNCNCSSSNTDRVHKADVLCGRGGRTNHHPGNVYFRTLVRENQAEYLRATKKDKAGIARKIVDIIRKSGRFLKRDSVISTESCNCNCKKAKQSDDVNWIDIGNRKAREKTSQALREGAPELRQGVANILPSSSDDICSEEEPTTTNTSTDSSSCNKRTFDQTLTLSATTISHDLSSSKFEKLMIEI